MWCVNRDGPWMLARARRTVLAPLSTARPSLLPPAAVTLKATEWAWGIVKSRCVEPEEPPLPAFEDPILAGVRGRGERGVDLNR